MVKEVRPKALKTVSKAAFTDAWKNWLVEDKKDLVKDGE